MKYLWKICLGGAVVALIAIFVFKVPLNSILLFAGFLLCPLMHVFMMNHGGHSEKTAEDHSKHEPYERKTQTIHS